MTLKKDVILLWRFVIRTVETSVAKRNQLKAISWRLLAVEPLSIGIIKKVLCVLCTYVVQAYVSFGSKGDLFYTKV